MLAFSLIGKAEMKQTQYARVLQRQNKDQTHNKILDQRASN